MYRPSAFASSLLLLLSLACAGDEKGVDTATSDGADGAEGTEGTEEPTWSYEGETGPEYWGTLSEEWSACSEGTAQSPIDVNSFASELSDLPLPEITWGETPLSAYNSGHYIRYEVGAGSSLTWNGATYNLKQFHFHGLSEHTVDGERFDVEIHFVHARADDPNRYAVVAILASAAPEGAVEGVFGEGGALLFPDALALPESETPTELGGTVDLGLAFADVLATPTIGTYTGSLTTPPCTEGVEFLILGTVLPMVPEEVAAFHAVYDFNYRPVQDANGRTVQLMTEGVPE